jgi:hypothetical protein
MWVCWRGSAARPGGNWEGGADGLCACRSGRRGGPEPVVADEQERELRGRGRGSPPAEREQVVHPTPEFEQSKRPRLP